MRVQIPGAAKERSPTAASCQKGKALGEVLGKGAKRLGKCNAAWLGLVDWQGGRGNVMRGGSPALLAAIKQAVSPDTQVTFSAEANDLKNADVIIAVVGEPPYAEMKGDREHLDLSEADTALIARAKASGAPVVTILYSKSPLALGSALVGERYVVAAWLPGSEGSGMTDMLFGDYKFTGKLPRVWLENDQTLFPFGFGLTGKSAGSICRSSSPRKAAGLKTPRF